MPKTNTSSPAVGKVISQTPKPPDTQDSTPPAVDKPKAKRVRLNYTTTIDTDALKLLEKKTLGSFRALAKKVVKIDGVPFGDARYINAEGNESSYKLAGGRKEDLLREIRHNAMIEFIGMKCHVAKVYVGDEEKVIGDFYTEKHKIRLSNP
jgi:hypothetical protein